MSDTGAPTPPHDDDTLAALDWLIAAGADEAIEAHPVDRYADSAAHTTAPAPSPRPAAPHAATPGPIARVARPEAAPPLWTPSISPPTSADAAVADARALADAAQSLDELYTAIGTFEGCPLRKSASNTVIRRGSEQARVMLIGEAPGRDEDIQGKPFVGTAGQLLDAMLRWIGLDESNCYITNILFWRPPGNRTPEAREIAVCLPFVERHIELLHPQLLLLMGGISAKTLLGESRGITKLRGQWFAYRHEGMQAPIPALATLHPAYLLRQPGQKRLAWRDLVAFKRALDGRLEPPNKS